jgi:hypothetical protein
MNYLFFSDFGGFIWWVFIKFCSTRLEEEQAKEKESRNIIVLIVTIYLIGFVTVKLL